MKIGMVFYDMQDIGGLEEYAVSLAAGLKESGHDVNVFSTFWADPQNQYFQRLTSSGVHVVQPPKWISYPASDWETKEKITSAALTLLAPLTFLLALALWVRKNSWQEGVKSARGWMNGHISRLVAPDRRESLGRLWLNGWSRRWKPDVLHLQGYTTNLLFVIDWAAAAGLPIVYEEHQTPDEQFDWWDGFKDTVNLADVVIAVSQKSAVGLRTVCGVTRPIFVRNPLLPDPIANIDFQRRIRSPQDTQLQMTAVARLAIAKGLSHLLKAIVLVQKKYPNATFKVYGSGEMREQLLAEAAQLALPGEEIFVGPFTTRDELTAIMSQTDIFVLSSVLEGQPLGLVEAMAFGCPIATTNVGGIPELIQDGHNGLLCSPADPEGLAEAICRLIADPSLRERLGENARQTYLNGPYQPAALAKDFIAIYGSVIDGTPISTIPERNADLEFSNSI